MDDICWSTAINKTFAGIDSLSCILIGRNDIFLNFMFAWVLKSQIVHFAIL